MEDINNANNKVIVKASDVLKKLKSPKDRRNFALENSMLLFLCLSFFCLDWFIPNLKGYDATFLLQVMKGEKKCLPVGFQTGFNLNYFRKGETLNKAYIINKIANNPKFGEYLPDNISPMSLSRDFLLTVSYLYLIISVSCILRPWAI